MLETSGFVGSGSELLPLDALGVVGVAVPPPAQPLSTSAAANPTARAAPSMEREDRGSENLVNFIVAAFVRTIPELVCRLRCRGQFRRGPGGGIAEGSVSPEYRNTTEAIRIGNTSNDVGPESLDRSTMMQSRIRLGAAC